VLEMGTSFIVLAEFITNRIGGTERVRFVRGNDWSNFGGTFEVSLTGSFCQ